MIQFDKQGYITPAEIIEIDFDIFEKTFTFNEHRQLIFQEYLIFLNELKALNIGSFYQWINGSFTTLKSNPNDIDVVTFVHFEEYKQNEQKLYELKNHFKSRKIDSYFVAVYPKEHMDYSLFLNYDYDFCHKFTRDFKREIRLKTKIKKGFVKIEFKNEQ